VKGIAVPRAPRTEYYTCIELSKYL